MSVSPNSPDKISVSVKRDIHNKKTIQLRLQGLLESALEDMARDRREEMSQTIRDIIEQRLVKDGYLPEWWFERADRRI